MYFPKQNQPLKTFALLHLHTFFFYKMLKIQISVSNQKTLTSNVCEFKMASYHTYKTNLKC